MPIVTTRPSQSAAFLLSVGLLVAALACSRAGLQAPARAAPIGSTPASQREILSQAEAAERDGQWKEAADLYQRVVNGKATTAKERQERLQALQKLAFLYRQLGKYQQALPLYEFLHKQNLERRSIRRSNQGNLVVAGALALSEVLLALDRAEDAAAKLSEAERHITKVHPVLAAKLAIARAGLGQQQGLDQKQQRALWEAAKTKAEDGLASIDARVLSRQYRSQLVHCLIPACEATGDLKRAVDLLREQIAVLRKSKSQDKQEVKKLAEAKLWQKMGEIYHRGGWLDDARRLWEHAQKITRGLHSPPRSVLADLSDALGTLAVQQKRPQDAVGHFHEAVDHYAAALDKAPGAIQQETLRTWRRNALRRLTLLGTQLDRLDLANQAAEELLKFAQDNFPAGHPRILKELQDVAALETVAGDFASAYQRLVKVVRHRGDDQPREKASALTDLATVEGAMGDVELAHRHAQEARKLQIAHLADDDLDHIRTQRVLGQISLSKGRFHEAVDWYGKAREVCRVAREKTSDQALLNKVHILEAAVLLDLSIVYKLHGQYKLAATHCQSALNSHRRTFPKDDPSIANFKNAQAALERLRKRPEQAAAKAREALEICQSRDQVLHPTAATAHHQLALIARDQHQWLSAYQHWRQELKIHRTSGQPLLEARTHNMLGLLDFEGKRFAGAEAHFRAARTLQETHFAPPKELYRTYCNLAGSLHRQGRIRQALPLLDQAISQIELMRATVVGGEQERAEFYEHYSASVFDPIVEWNVESGKISEALLAVERSRNRTFLEQLQLAGVDLRETIQDTHQPLLKQERALQRTVAHLRSQARSAQARQQDITSLLEQLKKAQQEYADCWTAIRHASPYYRDLLVKHNTVQPVQELRRTALQRGELMLVYYLGGSKSFLFAIESAADVPGKNAGVSVFPLTSPSRIRLGIGSQDTLLATRGPVGIVLSEKPDQPVITKNVSDQTTESTQDSGVRSSSEEQFVPLTRSQTRKWVSAYLQRLTGRGVKESKKGNRVDAPSRPITQPSAGDSKDSRPRGDGDAPVEPPTLLANVLLPPEVREFVKRRQPRRLVIVSDGILHQLPFEALVTSTQGKVRFLLDEFPPITYSPSANILACLCDRLDSSAQGEATLLTVGNPVYSTVVAKVNTERSFRKRSYLGLGGSLAALPATKGECQRVANTFSHSSRQLLLGKEATEHNVIRFMAGRQYVHLATHGLVDPSYGNLFGAIALSDPLLVENASEDEDGFLTLAEIHALPLKECELAVLSACKTNVGAKRPLEAGTTLAQGFLAAGARRVIASHWSVADESTAELIGTFFEEIARQRKAAEPITYAEALQKARKKLREGSKDPRWASPYYWAPFVLIGPGESR